MKKEQRWWDLLSTIFLLAALLTCSSRLASTHWAAELDRTSLLVFLGLTLGLLLGLSHFHSLMVSLFGFVYSLFFVTWQLILPTSASQSWSERLLALAERIHYNLQQLSANQPLSDPILFLLLMYLLFWLLGLFGGYQLTREGRPWTPLIVAGASLLIIEYYISQFPTDHNSAFYIGSFILFSILLVAQLYYLKLAQRWEEQNVIVESSLRYDLGRSALIASILVLFITWNIPTFVEAIKPGSEANSKVMSAWDRFARRFQHIVEPLNGPLIIEVEYMGRNLGLGSGQPLSDQTVFTVTVQQPPPAGVNYYWRGRTYDYYRNGEWQNTLSTPSRRPPTQSPYAYPWQDRYPLDFTFTAQTNMRSLYAPGDLVSINQTVEIWLDRLPQNQVDVQGLVKTENLSVGQSYQVRSLIAAPTVRELRAAGQDYPTEIITAYLQLPTDLPNRIRELAQTIAGNQPTPYDKAIAITNYLRNEMQYSTTVPTLPQQRDPVDWFLFTGKRGFCNYYASAEVLMLRSLGVPARLSAGYARGENDPSGKTFTIRQKDSHAWPEVYFPNIGWVEFEPTAALSNISHPSGEQTSPPQAIENDAERLRDRPMLDDEAPGLPPQRENPAATTSSQSAPSSPLNLAPIIVSVTSSIVLLSLGLLYWKRRQIIRLPILLCDLYQTRTHQSPPTWLQNWSEDSLRLLQHRIGPPSIQLLIPWQSLVQRVHPHLPFWLQITPIQRSFLSVDIALRLLGRPPRPSQTPAERVAILQKLIPEAVEPAQNLLRVYESTMYSPHPGDPHIARHSATQLFRIALINWLKRLLALTNPDVE
jgi:transglutaminase-like putative cysteine protease